MPNPYQYDSGFVYDVAAAYNAFAPSQPAFTATVSSHLSTSMTLDKDGYFNIVVQDTMEDIAQSVEMIVGTGIGSRTVVPTFGIPQQPFENGNQGNIEKIISTWENRATSVVTVTTDPVNLTESIQVAVSRNKGSSHR